MKNIFSIIGGIIVVVFLWGVFMPDKDEKFLEENYSFIENYVERSAYTYRFQWEVSKFGIPSAANGMREDMESTKQLMIAYPSDSFYSSVKAYKDNDYSPYGLLSKSFVNSILKERIQIRLSDFYLMDYTDNTSVYHLEEYTTELTYTILVDNNNGKRSLNIRLD